MLQSTDLQLQRIRLIMQLEITLSKEVKESVEKLIISIADRMANAPKSFLTKENAKILGVFKYKKTIVKEAALKQFRNDIFFTVYETSYKDSIYAGPAVFYSDLTNFAMNLHYAVKITNTITLSNDSEIEFFVDLCEFMGV